MRSAIEQVIGRDLEREKRNGIDHFVSGQIGVADMRPSVDEYVPDEYDGPVVELSYVDAMGHACWLVCIREEADWEVMAAIRGGQTTASRISPPRLSERLLEALEGAVRPAGQDAVGDQAEGGEAGVR